MNFVAFSSPQTSCYTPTQNMKVCIQSVAKYNFFITCCSKIIYVVRHKFEQFRFYACVCFWLLSHVTRDLSQGKKVTCKVIHYTDRNILKDYYYSKIFSGFPALGVQNCFDSRKQFCSPRAGNPGNVLLTSWNPPQYFYQCIFTQNDILQPF
jgi:hypothetical protein